jgi:hypothetical protein
MNEEARGSLTQIRALVLGRSRIAAGPLEFRVQEVAAVAGEGVVLTATVEPGWLSTRRA